MGFFTHEVKDKLAEICKIPKDLQGCILFSVWTTSLFSLLVILLSCTQLGLDV